MQYNKDWCVKYLSILLLVKYIMKKNKKQFFRWFCKI